MGSGSPNKRAYLFLVGAAAPPSCFTIKGQVKGLDNYYSKSIKLFDKILYWLTDEDVSSVILTVLFIICFLVMLLIPIMAFAGAEPRNPSKLIRTYEK